MNFINHALSTLFDLLLWPFQSLTPVWGLSAISLVSGVIFLLIYGRVSNQRGLRAVKEKIHARLLEAVLYRHDIGVSLRAQGQMFLLAFRYVAYALPPIIILVIPCLLILAQLQLRYDAAPLKAGTSALVETTVRDAALLEKLELIVPQGVRASPPVRDLEARQAFWRIDISANEPASITLKTGSSAEDKALRSTARVQSLAWALLYPGEKLLPRSGAISSISVKGPLQRHVLFGIEMHWVVIFLLLSIVSGIAASRIWKVEI